MVAALQERPVQKQQNSPKYENFQSQIADEPVEGAQLRRFTLDEYHQLIESGFFQPHERIELINGYLVMMSPLNPPHAAATTRLMGLFYEQLGRFCITRVQQPVILQGPKSEPEPDIVLAKSRADFYAQEHPGVENILLLVEVSDSTLRYDRTTKKRDYAAEGIADYWIINLEDEQIEVYRDPLLSVAGKADYETKLIFARGQTLAPLKFPECVIAVDEVMPGAKD